MHFNKSLLCTLAAVLLITLPARGQINDSVDLKEIKHFPPVNENASPEARQLLEYLYSISGKKIIAGHQNYVGQFNTYPERVKELTGKLPEIWGCDFINYYMNGNPEAIVKEAYKKYQEGYIITMMWHQGRPLDDPPFGWKESIQNKLNAEQWKELTTPGTPLYNKWLRMVDTVATYLKALQILGVPVLWRPYHEMNGIWFWWGNKKGKDGFVKLWKMMYDRYVNHFKLNNLIWVWDANSPRDLKNDEAYAFKEFFPGLNYVDVLATDVYHYDYKQSAYDDLVKLSGGKPVALGEVGSVPSPEILKAQPRWTWFMIWGDWVNSHNTPKEIEDLYNYPGVLTHKDFIKDEK